MNRLVAAVALALSCASPASDAQTVGTPLSASAQMVLEKSHKSLVGLLSPEQVAKVDSVYPGFRLIKACAGRFSGTEHDELILGVWKPVESNKWWARETHRVGLIWTLQGWAIHNIDDEIEVDHELSKSQPMLWEHSVAPDGIKAEMKCGIEGEFTKGSDLTGVLGDKPFFDLKENGLSTHKVACFATSDVYNNWDCVVFSPRDNRFRLWYQQAHAD